jgi:hypothetical protein
MVAHGRRVGLLVCVRRPFHSDSELQTRVTSSTSLESNIVTRRVLAKLNEGLVTLYVRMIDTGG